MNRLMKDSGIDWIGKIPRDWKIVKVKNIFQRRKEINIDNEPIILSLARSGVKIRDITNNEGQIAESYDNYNTVKIGDLLLNPMDLISGANCSISKVEGVISPAYVNLFGINYTNTVYYDYYFKNQYWTNAMFIHGKGVSFNNRWTINNETIMNYYLPLPNKEEQTEIANYLDKKCKIIDKLIEENRKSIEKMEEYKDAISNNIFFNIKNKHNLKDIILKRIVKVNQGLQISQELRHKKNGKNRYIYITVKYLNSKDNNNEEYIENPPKSVICTKDDILVARTGTTGKIITNVEGVFHNNFFRVNYKDNILKNYLYHYLNMRKCQEYMLLMSGTTTIPDLNHGDFLNMKIILPSLEVQQEIVEYLDKKCSIIDQVINKRKVLIEKLEEYKKSLIYEAVTGKIEV